MTALVSLRPVRRRRVALAALLAALVALAAAVGCGESDATAEGEPFEPLFTRSVGDFDVAVRWLPPAPQVGFVNIAVEPRLSESGEAVADARVLLVAESEPEHPVFEVVAVNTPSDPTVYRANMKFEEAGNWALRVSIDSPSGGEADFRAPLVVLPAPIQPGAGGGWVFLGIFIALCAGSFYLIMASRKAQAARRRSLEG